MENVDEVVAEEVVAEEEIVVEEDEVVVVAEQPELVPAYADIAHAQERGLANVATWRLACRLDDLGMMRTAVAEPGVQAFPRKAVAAFQSTLGLPATGRYDEATHHALWAL